MMNKWLLRVGSSILALTLITGCATNNDEEDMEPIEDAPLEQNENNGDNGDMMDEENGDMMNKDNEDMMDEGGTDSGANGNRD